MADSGEVQEGKTFWLRKIQANKAKGRQNERDLWWPG